MSGKGHETEIGSRKYLFIYSRNQLFKLFEDNEESERIN